jgi:hypothetical protein
MYLKYQQIQFDLKILELLKYLMYQQIQFDLKILELLKYPMYRLFQLLLVLIRPNLQLLKDR